MKLTIENASQFRDEFRQCGRADQFSYEALGLLFDYLEDVDPDHDLDVIALCCEYAEASPQDIARDYNISLNVDTAADAALAYLQDETFVIGVTSFGSIVYAQF